MIFSLSTSSERADTFCLIQLAMICCLISTWMREHLEIPLNWEVAVAQVVQLLTSWKVCSSITGSSTLHAKGSLAKILNPKVCVCDDTSVTGEHSKC